MSDGIVMESVLVAQLRDMIERQRRVIEAADMVAHSYGLNWQIRSTALPVLEGYRAVRRALEPTPPRQSSAVGHQTERS
jgi:hypothetical protein